MSVVEQPMEMEQSDCIVSSSEPSGSTTNVEVEESDLLVSSSESSGSTTTNVEVEESDCLDSSSEPSGSTTTNVEVEESDCLESSSEPSGSTTNVEMDSLTAGALQETVNEDLPELNQNADLQIPSIELLDADRESIYSDVLLSEDQQEIDDLMHILEINRSILQLLDLDEELIPEEEIGNPTELIQEEVENDRVDRIDTLTLNGQNSVAKWRIRARVTEKRFVHKWCGESAVYHVNFLDESGEIRATGFTDTADKLYDLLEVNEVFYVSGCELIKGNSANSNELYFNRYSVVTKCMDEVDVPYKPLKFVPINKIEQLPTFTVVDVIGVLKSGTDLMPWMHDLEIVDMSGKSVLVTIWGYESKDFKVNGNPVIAAKGVTCALYGGLSRDPGSTKFIRGLSVAGLNQLELNPDLPEARMLREWYDREDRSKGVSNQVNQENPGQGATADWSTKATAMHPENSVYEACLTENCNSVLVDQGDDMWRCEECQTEFPNYKWRKGVQNEVEIAPILPQTLDILRGALKLYNAEVQAEVQAEAQAEVQAEVRAEVQAEAKAEAKAEVQAEAEAKAEVQAEVQAEAKAEAKAEAQAEVQAEVQAEAKAEAQAEVQAEVQAEAQAEAQAECLANTLRKRLRQWN